jgi:hypothetical protein
MVFRRVVRVSAVFDSVTIESRRVANVARVAISKPCLPQIRSLHRRRASPSMPAAVRFVVVSSAAPADGCAELLDDFAFVVRPAFILCPAQQ